jgi:DNA-binding NtrC family response regulator
MKNKGSVLIVDDEPNALRVLSAILQEDGYSVHEATAVDEAIRIIREQAVDAIITDMRMPARDGMHLFNYIRSHHPRIPVMFLTAFGTVESAVEAVTNGAFYYFIKPPDYQKLKAVLEQAIEHGAAEQELDRLLHQPAAGADSCRIIGTAPQIIRIRQTIEAVKNSESSVLIQGETGTGKEVVACNLHYGSTRSAKPFIAVNCAAIPRDLIESELFGYEKGAFTGANGHRIGKFEEASGGTVFLDEIGELEMSLQAKLLRVLQERSIERLGSNRKIKVDFRLISSTNRNLKQEIANGTFREDLFYRINVVQIDVPSLRERANDIPLLAAEFIEHFCRREKKLITLSEEVMESFRCFPWPGNVRQLKNVIERAVVLARGKRVTLNELPDELRLIRRPELTLPVITPLKALELQAIRDAIRDCSGNKSKAARKLGISRKALYKKLNDSCSTSVGSMIGA